MRWGKRISHLLILVILCILIFYAGIYIQIGSSGDVILQEMGAGVIRLSGQMYLPGLFYEEEVKAADENIYADWIVRQAMNLIPLGVYVKQSEGMKVQTEDDYTYEMILEMQAEDENEVDEEGKLVDDTKEEASVEAAQMIPEDKLGDFDYLISQFYTVDSSTSVTESLFDVTEMLSKDMKINQKKDGPKILIYHTHSQEAFKDSEKGNMNETIMGMGAYLTKILNDKYGIETMHHEGVYDLIDGKLDRSKAYQLAEKEIEKILDEHPSIEVVIDLHRDGVRESTHLVTEINGKKTAQIMFFNGLSRTRANGDISYLKNPYIEDNLAFSLQMQLEALEKYPGFTRRIYLKSYRYNMHLAPKTLLIEAGAQTNTVAEMKRAMKVLAEILDSVLTG